MSALFVSDLAGGYCPAPDNAVIHAAAAAVSRRFRRGMLFDSPAATREGLIALLATRDHETFCVAHLDNRHRLIELEQMFRGTIDGASVYPREVVKSALAHNSAAVILVHNHPSGVAEPSAADEIITKRLKAALALVEIRVLDHFIVAGDQVLSFAERGLL